MYYLPFGNNDNIIELGGGANPLFRPNVDIIPYPTVDIVADISKPLPIDNDAYDGVFCSYVLEHISWRKVRQCLSEIHRILRPGGIAVFITSNTYEQAKYVVSKEENDGWTDNENSCLFGDQNYDGNAWDANAHHSGFSPSYITNLLQEAGFADVIIMPHPNTITDMIIEARKQMQTVDPNKWTTDDRKKAYNRHYFDGARGAVGGYAREGYWDFPVHWITFRKIMELKPESVLELGCARGYILKRIEDEGIRVRGLEISDHCYQTRVVNDVVTWDITQTPWPIKDKEFDLIFSMATLEHIPEDKIDAIAKEMDRVSKRGLHGVDLGIHDDHFDKTHCTFKPIEWWKSKLPPTHEVVDKESLESGNINPPQGDGKVKLNIGSYTTMFHWGWTNMDLYPQLIDFANRHGFIYRVHDMTRPLPFDDGIVDMIYHCHFLEHLDYKAGGKFLKECARVMKPGGIMRIIMPDTRGLMEKYFKGDLSQFDEINDNCAASPAQIAKLWTLLMSGHNSMWDEETLKDTLIFFGFRDVRRMNFRQSMSKQMLRETQDMFPSLSLFVEAVR
ncbi:MAG: methyltransferase domain-containing protein [Nitrososphaerales archaeon]